MMTTLLGFAAEQLEEVRNRAALSSSAHAAVPLRRVVTIILLLSWIAEPSRRFLES